MVPHFKSMHDKALMQSGGNKTSIIQIIELYFIINKTIQEKKGPSASKGF